MPRLPALPRLESSALPPAVFEITSPHIERRVGLRLSARHAFSFPAVVLAMAARRPLPAARPQEERLKVRVRHQVIDAAVAP